MRVQADDGGGADVWVLKRCEACVIRRQLLQAIIAGLRLLGNEFHN